jgi:hypothetical protein
MRGLADPSVPHPLRTKHVSISDFQTTLKLGASSICRGAKYEEYSEDLKLPFSDTHQARKLFEAFK